MAFVLLIVVLSLLPGAADADVIELQTSKDNTLYESDAPLSNGAGQHFFVGTTPTNGRRRALLAFDVANRVPAGSTVVSVSLRLHVSHERGNVVVELHRALADWGEGSSVAPRGEGGGGPAALGDATWLVTFWDDGGEPPTWTNPGGDFDRSPSAFTPIGGLGWYTVNSTERLVADVQDFLDSPEGNFGWVLTAQIETVLSPTRFDSRENSFADYRPLLMVEFVPPD